MMPPESHRLKTDLLAIALLAATVFLGLSLLSFDPADPPSQVMFPARTHVVNTCGPVGAHLAHALRDGLGVGAWFVLVSLIVLDGALFARRRLDDFWLRAVGWSLLLATVCIGVRLVAPTLPGSPIVGSGGYLGACGEVLLNEHFSLGGTAILLMSTSIAGMLLTTDTLLFRLLSLAATGPVTLFYRLSFGRRAAHAQKIDAPLTASKAATKRPIEDPAESNSGIAAAPAVAAQAIELAAAAPPVDETATLNESAADVAPSDDADLIPLADSGELPEETDEIPPTAAPLPVKQPRQPIRINPPVVAPRRPTPAAPPPEFRLPDLELLEDAEEFPYDLLAEKARVAAAILEKTFKEFGLNVRVVEVDTGPVITQFELELEAGLRLSKVTNLADDLAIALRVPSVRVVAPIPGKNTVGVEVPNDKQVMVRLRELIESCPDATAKKRIPFFLGKDVSGRPLVVDLAKMPHLLIAGRTGTGKSVCLNALILSILMSRTPDQVKMLMIDPKMVELSPYKRVPHLMHPVITDMKKAEAVLAWSVDKMEERYDLLARCGVRHLDSYNELSRTEKLRRLGIAEDSEEAEQIPDNMPYIVIIADEMADMIMTSGKEVEGHIIRLAQKSRAVGIHLVLATQKPTVDVITGLIKSNLPARISFQVASRMDSRVVLDEMGAERLLGNGDMLYLAPGTSKISRAQGTYVSDDEVNQVIEFYSDCEPQYSKELAQLSTRSSNGQSGIDAIRSRDEMYEPAIDVVVREGRGSVSLLQRCLGIGYGRAARLIDYMAEDGIVGDYNGSQAREVLFTPEQWAEIQAGRQMEDSLA